MYPNQKLTLQQRYKANFETVYQLLEEFSQESSINGLRHMFNRSSSKIARICWSLAFLVAFALLIQSVTFLAERYSRRQFKTVVENTHYPVHKIAFPEVTICNRNRLNWARLQEAKDLYLLPHQHNTTLEDYFTQIVGRYDTFTFGKFKLFENLEPAALNSLNYINFTSVVRHMSWRCEELLSDCIWRHHPMNCCDIFIPRSSQLGLCLAFNSVESAHGKQKQLKDSRWPWRASGGGPGEGLSLKVFISEEQHTPFIKNSKGITLMAIEPTVWYYIPMDIATNTSTRLILDAFVNRYDAHTQQVPSNVRECVFKDERKSKDFKTLLGHKYRFENCQSECQQEHLMRYCNCSLDLFYPSGPYPICQLKDMPCLAKYNQHLQYIEQPGQREYVSSKFSGIVCRCFQSCDSLRYLINVKSSDRIYEPYRASGNNTLIDLDIYFQREYIIAYKTVMVYTWVDLIASFGGIATLFLGSSLISIVELLYFFCIKVPKRGLKQYSHESKMGQRSLKAKQSLAKLAEYRFLYKKPNE